MNLLETRLSRVLFVICLAVMFYLLHWTSLLVDGGVSFDQYERQFERSRENYVFYPLLLIVVPLLVSALLPLPFKWIMDGK